MDPTLLKLNILVGETHSHKGKARAKATKELCDFLLTAPSLPSSSSSTAPSSHSTPSKFTPHLPAYLHIIQELALLTDYQPRKSLTENSNTTLSSSTTENTNEEEDDDDYIDIEIDTRRITVKFLVALANDPQYLSRVVPTLATLSSDKDIEITTQSFTGLALTLRPAFLNILHFPHEESNIKSWSTLYEIIHRIPHILQVNELPKDIHRAVLHFAEQYIYMFTPLHIPPPSVLQGIDMSSATSVTIDMIPVTGHLFLRKDNLMNEATQAVNAILASIVRNSPGMYPKQQLTTDKETKEDTSMKLESTTKNEENDDEEDMEIDHERLDAEIVTCQRIGILRIGFAMMIIQGLFTLARKPPHYVAGTTDHNQIVLVSQYQKLVKTALALIRNSGCTPDMVNQIDSFLRGPELSQLATKPYKPVPPPSLDISITNYLPPNEIIDFIMINLINFEGLHKKKLSKKQKKGNNQSGSLDTMNIESDNINEEDTLLYKFLDTVATEEMKLLQPVASTNEYNSNSGNTLTTSDTKGGVSKDIIATKASIYNVPAVMNWYHTTSLPWQTTNPLDDANYALHRIIMDTYLPQYMTDVNKAPNPNTSSTVSNTTYANILKSIIGSHWITTIDRLLTLLQMITSSSSSGPTTTNTDTNNDMMIDTTAPSSTETNTASQDLILMYIPLCEALLEQMFPSTPSASPSLVLHTLDIGQVRRLTTMLALACTRIYYHSNNNDQYIKLTYLSLNAILGAIQRMERYDTADLLLQFIMDIPVLPTGIINILANLCVKGLILQLPDNIQEYMEKSAMACLIYALLLRPKLRYIIVDTILALTVLDQVGEIAHKSALGNVTKRLLSLTSFASTSSSASNTGNNITTSTIRDHTLLFIRSCLQSCIISCRTHTQQLIENNELDINRSKRRKLQDATPSLSTSEELSETLYTGSSTPIDICIQVDSMFAGVHVNILTMATVRQIVRLALGGAMNNPSLLMDIFHMFTEIYNENNTDESLPIILEEIRNNISNIHKVSKKSYGYLLLSFVCSQSTTIETALTTPTPSNIVSFSIQSSEVQFLMQIIEILGNTIITEIMEDIQRKEDATLQTSTSQTLSTTTSSTTATPTIDYQLLRSHRVIQELLLAIKCITLVPDLDHEQLPNGNADINGIHTPLLLLPVAAILPTEELRTLIRQGLGNGNTTSIRSLMNYIMRTPNIIPALTKEEIIATFIIEANRINDRTEPCTTADKVRLLTEVSNVIFENKEVFSDMIILAGLRKIIDLSIQLHIAQPTLTPVTPILFMRCMLVMVQTYPETRSSILDLLLLYLRKVGVYVFENIDILQNWSTPPTTPATTNVPTCHVWEGFIILVKATIPLSLTLLAELPAVLLKLILTTKSQLPLAQRFRNWFSTWTGRHNAPKHIAEYIALIPTSSSSTSSSTTTSTSATTNVSSLPSSGLPSLGGIKRER